MILLPCPLYFLLSLLIAKNTLSLLQTASQRRGIERSIIRNLAEAEYISTKFDKR
jgi:hypothetical protein